jgi:hypothetical protein
MIKKGAGYYNCYCKLFPKSDINNESHLKFCKQYYWDTNYFGIMSIVNSIILIIVNIFLESINKNYITSIGYSSTSTKDSIILISNFIT